MCLVFLLLQVTVEKPATTPQKRHAPITFDSSNGSTNKQTRTSKTTDNMKLYTPPSGKFSNNFQQYGNYPFNFLFVKLIRCFSVL